MNSVKFLFSRLFLPAILVILLWSPAAFSQDAPAAAQETLQVAPFVGTVMHRVDIVIAECPWCRPTIEQLARDLIALHEKERFTAERYRQSMESLELSGRFEEILPSVQPLADGLAVTFALKPAREIRDIRVKGEYPLFTSDVLKSMSVYPGDTLLPGALTVHEARIGDLYTREGYIKPKVTIADEPDKIAGTALLKVQIETGPYFALDDLSIDGNRSMSTTEIELRMDIWRSSFLILESGRFRGQGFDRDVKSLTSLYWKRRYPECEIRSTITKDPLKASVAVNLAITEGPRYEVFFSGNHRFWSAKLKKDLILFKEGNRRDRGLRKSIENIKRRYRMAGFPFTEVRVLEEKIAVSEFPTRRIELAISEGPHTIVKSVRFSGNSAFEAPALKKLVKTGRASFFREADYIPNLLDKDLAAIQNRYLKAGYQDMKITPDIVWNKDKTAVDITLKIDEGVKSSVKMLTIMGLATIPLEQTRESMLLKAGLPFNAAILKTDEITLANSISDTGHPYVSVKSDASFTPDRSGVEVTFKVDEGPFVRMGNVYYYGNLKTRTRVLDRELGIKPGEKFSLTSLMEGQKNIRDMGIFKSVQFKTLGLKEKEDYVTLLVDMEETPPHYVQAGIGYTSDRGLYGNTRAGDRNLFGLDYNAWLGGEISQIGYNGEVNLKQRRFFGTPISTTYSVSYERKEDFNQTFGTTDLISSVTFLREFKPRHITTSLGFRYERREQFPRNSSTVTDDTYLPRGIFVTTPGIAYDTRDSFVRPSKGLYSSVSVDVSKGLLNSLDNFLKYKFLLRGYWQPLSRLTFAGMGSAGYIDPYDTGSSIPADQLFYLGGTFTVRGFTENMLRYDSQDNPVGGRTSLNGSLEARLELTRAFEATFFYDTGTVRQPITNAGSDAFRSSVGLGLRYVTPIGPIGLLYGLKINPREGESPGCFHFSIGYTF